MRSPGLLQRIIEGHIPERHRGVGRRLLDEVGDVAPGYVRGSFLMALIMAAIYGTSLLILGVPLWAGIGLIAGFLGIIPYFGCDQRLNPGTRLCRPRWSVPRPLGRCGAVFAIAQVIEDYVLMPRIIGDKLELHPMLVFISLIIAGDLFGLLGLVLVIPVLAVIKVLIRFLDELYLRSDFYLAPAPATPDGGSLLRSAQWRPLSRQPRRRLTLSELWQRAKRRRRRSHDYKNLARRDRGSLIEERSRGS